METILTIAKTPLSIFFEVQLPKKDSKSQEIDEQEMTNLAAARGEYTQNALLYQDILRYCLLQEKPTEFKFKFTEIAGWLVENNREFLDYYKHQHDGKTSKINKRRQRMQNCIDILENLGLIELCGTVKAEKNNNIKTPLYRFTNKCCFIAYLKKINDHRFKEQDNIDQAYENAYNILLTDKTIPIDIGEPQSRNGEPLSEEVFLHNLLTKIKEKKLHHHLIDAYIALLHSKEQDNTIYQITLRHILFDGSNFEKITQSQYWNLTNEVVNEMDKETRELWLHNMKLKEETNAEKPFNKAMEKARYENRDNYSKVVIGYHCKNCNQSGGIPFDILAVLKARYLQDGYLDINCQTCGKEQKTRSSSKDHEFMNGLLRDNMIIEMIDYRV